VWGGLYCFPLFDDRETLVENVPTVLRAALEDAPTISHALTHKDLFLHPVRVTLASNELAGSPGIWVGADQWPGLGLPAPIRKLLIQG
jgi:A/G-specific adenine glycosylase